MRDVRTDGARHLLEGHGPHVGRFVRISFRLYQSSPLLDAHCSMDADALVCIALGEGNDVIGLHLRA